MSRFDVVALGENSVDVVVQTAAPPTVHGPANKQRIVERSVRCGGQAATMVTAAARLGLSTAYVGAFGSDAHGRVIREALLAEGVDVAHAVVRDVPNRYAIILVERRGGERMVLWDRDETLALPSDAVPDSLIHDTRILHVDATEESAALSAVERARRAGALVTTDVDVLSPEALSILRSATHAIVAEHVPAEMTGCADLATAMRRMRETIPGVIVVTRGQAGAAALDVDGQWYGAPGFQVSARDATGAGDVFRGAFAAALIQGTTLADTLRFANAAAALSVTRDGALDGAPCLDEVQALLARRSPL